MKRLLCAALVPVLLLAGLGLTPVTVARADESAATTVGEAGDLRTASPDSAVGVLAAAGCGFFARWTVLTGGTQVGIIAGAVACCTPALVDALAAENPSAR